MRKLHCLLVSGLLLISGGLVAQAMKGSGKIVTPPGSGIPEASSMKNSKGVSGSVTEFGGAFFIGAKKLSDHHTVTLLKECVTQC